MSKDNQIISLVLGAGGFIGGHLVSKLKSMGNYVIGVDIKEHEFKKSEADKFIIGDLRNLNTVSEIITPNIDQVFQLAADMGGSSYINIGEHDSDVMHNSCLINLNVLKACSQKKIKKIFYASSACVYPEFNQEDPLNPKCNEDSVYPAQPDSEYGWEKLFSERLYHAFAKDYPFMNIRIARFHNIYGPFGCYDGGREKAPAAICRKVVKAQDGDIIEVLGTGQQTRSFLYIDQCIEGIIRLMNSDYREPLNIGSEEMISINDFAKMIIKISGKKLIIKNIPYKGIGVMGRNSDNRKIREILKWEPKYPLEDGIKITYQWILEEINKSINYDIIIPIGVHDLEYQLLKTHFEGIRKFRTQGKIYLVVNGQFDYELDENLAKRIVIINEKETFPYKFKEHQRTGWYFQQLIKLEAWKYIPNLTENYLVVDADTIFLKSVEMIDVKTGKMYLTVGNEYHKPYFKWMATLHPLFIRNHKESGICHHMLFNQRYLKEIMKLVERNHEGRAFWKVFLEMINDKEYSRSGASEYELYFHYMVGNHPDKIIVRKLNWKNSSVLDNNYHKHRDLDYYSYHWYNR